MNMNLRLALAVGMCAMALVQQAGASSVNSYSKVAGFVQSEYGSVAAGRQVGRDGVGTSFAAGNAIQGFEVKIDSMVGLERVTDFLNTSGFTGSAATGNAATFGSIPVPVPAPASVYLLGAGLIAFMGLRRKKTVEQLLS